MALKYKHTILLVDDEISVIKALQRLFRKEGYEILTASNGQEALEQLKTMKKRVSLIISDQRMPGMTGVQFLEASKKILPKTIRFLLTGYADINAVIDAINKGGIHRYLIKPWQDNDLIQQVRDGLEQYELILENKRLLVLVNKRNKELNALNRQLEQKVEERSKEIIKKNKEIESSFYNTVRAFASLLEIHAPALAGHGTRVALQSREMGQLLDLSEKEITHIEIAALLHDIGKLGFPQHLMDYRENKWTLEERALYEKHPEEGQNIVRFINNLDHVGLLIRSHHEWYDGRGYPDQLSEEWIPMGSRIIAVADAYDRIVYVKLNIQSFIDEYLEEVKITQNHVPENELLQQAALYYIKKNTFIKFDPDIVKSFFKLIKAKGIETGTEKGLSLDELKDGMVLTRSLYTAKGRFLLPYNTVLTGDYIVKLKIIHQTNPINDSIFVRSQ